jgi:hypothetical protein
MLRNPKKFNILGSTGALFNLNITVLNAAFIDSVLSTDL